MRDVLLWIENTGLGQMMRESGPWTYPLVNLTHLFGIATLLLYSLWILIVSAAFIVVKVDNLTYLFSSIFDAARWPASVFRGAVKFFFTFVIPLAHPLTTCRPDEE